MDDPDLIGRKKIMVILGLRETRTRTLMRFDADFPSAIHTALGDLYSEREVIEYARNRKPKPGHPKLPDEFYEQVAEVYRSQPRRRTQAVAVTLKGSRRQADRWVAEARARGFLPPSGRRKRKSPEA